MSDNDNIIPPPVQRESSSTSDAESSPGRRGCLRLPDVDDDSDSSRIKPDKGEEAGITQAAREYRSLHADSYPLPLSAHPRFRGEVNNGFVRRVDKFFQMYLGFSCVIEDYDGITATFKVKVTGGSKWTDRDIVEKVAQSWKTNVKALATAQRFVVKIYRAKEGCVGGTLGRSDHSSEDDFNDELVKLVRRVKLTHDALEKPGYPFVAYHGSYGDPANLAVVHHPDFTTRNRGT